MDSCYLCGVTFTEENNSKEHILPNSIGGRLKAKNLICIECNSTYGNEIDKELAKDFSFFSSFIDVKRDHGKNQDIKGGKTQSGAGYTITVENKIRKSDPQIKKIEKEDGLFEFEIKARSIEEANKIIYGLTSKHTGLKVNSFVEEEFYLQEPLNYKIGIGSDEMFKSLTKSAVNFYILNRKDKKEVEHILDYLKGSKDGKHAKHFYPRNSYMSVNDDEIFHLIHLVGNVDQKMLYCFIELFSAYSFLILLSDCYSGNNFSHTYCYDLIENKVIDKKLELTVVPEDFDFHSNLTSDDFKLVQEKNSRFFTIADKLKVKQEINSIIEDGYNNIIQKYSNPDYLTEEMRSEMGNYIANRFSQFIGRKYKEDL